MAASNSSAVVADSTTAVKISKIKRKDFKGIKDLEVIPARINILSGPKGMGKTSFMEGLRCAITRKIPDNSMAMRAMRTFVAVEVDGIEIILQSFFYGYNKLISYSVQCSIPGLYSRMNSWPIRG